MIRGRSWSFWFTAMIATAVLVVIVVSLGYDEKARLVPMLVAVPTLVLAVLVLFVGDRPGPSAALDADSVNLAEIAGLSEDAPGPPPPEGPRGSALSIILWIVLLCLLVLLVGFMVATPVFILFFMRLQARASWRASAAVAVIMFAVVYGGFDVLMKGDMFEGILFGSDLPPI
jgi:hypothetical protein